MITSISPRPNGHSIGIDVGGTKIAAGVVDADGSVVERFGPVASPTKGGDVIVSVLIDMVKGMLARHPDVEAIGVGAAGMIDWPAGRIRWAPNSPYEGVELRELLKAATGLPCVVDNDANVAAWAEMRLGNPTPYLAFLTIGTGIGGGLIMGGELYRGHSGIAAEIGHLTVDPFGGSRCGCGNVGCLEAVAAGPALGRYGREVAAAEPWGVIATVAGAPADVSGESVLTAARMRDPTAISLFDRIGSWLGIGIASLVNVLDVDRVVIGGGVASAGELLLTPTRASFQRYLFAGQHRRIPDIVPARLGPEAGWIGAALLALDDLSRSRTAAVPLLASGGADNVSSAEGYSSSWAPTKPRDA